MTTATHKIPAEVTAKARKISREDMTVYTIHPAGQMTGTVYTLGGDGDWQPTYFQAAGFSEPELSRWLDSQCGVAGGAGRLVRV